MSLTLIAIGFALSATALTFATGCCIERALVAPAGSGPQAGLLPLAALTALALVEHWLMILLVRDPALWKRMTPERTGAGLPAPRPVD